MTVSLKEEEEGVQVPLPLRDRLGSNSLVPSGTRLDMSVGPAEEGVVVVVVERGASR